VKNHKPKRPIVLVTWDDAATLDLGWSKENPVPEPHIMFSVGFLLTETNDHIVLAMDTDIGLGHNGQGQIPKGMIRSMKILKKANTPKTQEGTKVKDVTV